jgi:hypothetical protein
MLLQKDPEKPKSGIRKIIEKMLLVPA